MEERSLGPRCAGWCINSDYDYRLDVMTLTPAEERIRQTLTSQEAKVIMLMRDLPYQTIIVKMEHRKVIHKERIESIKD